jgi:uncharacterized protein
LIKEMMEKIKITNKSSNMVLVQNAEFARQVFPRMKGLLGRANLKDGDGLVIMPCSSVHTIGMRFPIDVIFFDKRRRIVAIRRNMKSFRLSAWHPAAAGVVEAAAGTFGELSAKAGDELDFQPAGV